MFSCSAFSVSEQNSPPWLCLLATLEYSSPARHGARLTRRVFQRDSPGRAGTLTAPNCTRRWRNWSQGRDGAELQGSPALRRAASPLSLRGPRFGAGAPGSQHPSPHPRHPNLQVSAASRGDSWCRSDTVMGFSKRLYRLQ